MTILIDADGCPVVDLTLRSAGKKGVPVVILCDTSHRIEREGAQTLVFDKGADSVDFALVNRVKPGDLVVTQDYGLASMCLAKCARVLNQNGLEYTADNISLSKNTPPKAFATAKAFGIIEENHLGRPPHGKARRRRPPQSNGY
jgi:uncharacterized protein YaiI (UPF0178 family)